MNYRYVKGNELDDEQLSAVLDDSKTTMVVAGAGTGKTMTILGKIKYLLSIMNVKAEEIICISFTNNTVNNLYDNILKECDISINVYTFHKLALTILDNYHYFYKISPNDYLSYIISEYFDSLILTKRHILKTIFNYLHIPVCSEYLYLRYIKDSKNIVYLKKLIYQFINLMKANDYDIYSFNDFIINNKSNNIFVRNSNMKILRIILDIYQEYYIELSSSGFIDFDGMISQATTLVKEKGYYTKLKYIIIDEFQDTSKLRMNLISSIINSTNASLFVVGDDFQSIYKFSGCDLSLFFNMSKYFKNVSMKKITTTYRNSRELISIAGTFIMKNEYQINKNLKSNKSLSDPIVFVSYKNRVNDFKKLLTTLLQDGEQDILILGRNNNDIYNYIDNEFSINGDELRYKNKIFRYLTVHKSKGLEASVVVLINLINDEYGFPNKIINASVINLVNDTIDKFPYSEERRLFYVALTRTKNKVYLFYPCKNFSVFVKEIKKYIDY